MHYIRHMNIHTWYTCHVSYGYSYTCHMDIRIWFTWTWYECACHHSECRLCHGQCTRVEINHTNKRDVHVIWIFIYGIHGLGMNVHGVIVNVDIVTGNVNFIEISHANKTDIYVMWIFIYDIHGLSMNVHGVIVNVDIVMGNIHVIEISHANKTDVYVILISHAKSNFQNWSRWTSIKAMWSFRRARLAFHCAYMWSMRFIPY